MFAVGEDGEREDEEGEDDDDDEGEEEVAQGNISNDERDNTDEHKWTPSTGTLRGNVVGIYRFLDPIQRIIKRDRVKIGSHRTYHLQ